MLPAVLLVSALAATAFAAVAPPLAARQIGADNPWYTCTATCGDVQELARPLAQLKGCPASTVDGLQVCYDCLITLPPNIRDELTIAITPILDYCRNYGKTTTYDNGPEPTATEEEDSMPTPSGGTIVVHAPTNTTSSPPAGSVNATGGASASVSPTAKPSSAGTAAGVSIGALVALVATYALL